MSQSFQPVASFFSSHKGESPVNVNLFRPDAIDYDEIVNAYKDAGVLNDNYEKSLEQLDAIDEKYKELGYAVVKGFDGTPQANSAIVKQRHDAIKQAKLEEKQAVMLSIIDKEKFDKKVQSLGSSSSKHANRGNNSKTSQLLMSIVVLPMLGDMVKQDKESTQLRLEK